LQKLFLHSFTKIVENDNPSVIPSVSHDTESDRFALEPHNACKAWRRALSEGNQDSDSDILTQTQHLLLQDQTFKTPMRLGAAVLASVGLVALALLPVGTSTGLGLKTAAFQPIPGILGATRKKACTPSCRPSTQLGYTPKDLLSKLRRVASSVLQTRKNVNKKVNARTSGLAGAKAMFTGIVEEMGEVDELMMDIKTPGVTLTIKGSTVLQGAYEGCSIAVNGVCLTVTVTLPLPDFALPVQFHRLSQTN
jgi:hypothetical protein